MTKRRVYACLFALILAFIWGNSMLTREVSGAISQVVASILGGGSGTTSEGHYLVRKLAHFTEYAALGTVAHLLFDSLTADRCKKYVTISLIGVATPLVDETIQIFSSRGPALSDVWIDVGGYIVGVLLTLAVLALVRKSGKRGENSD